MDLGEIATDLQAWMAITCVDVDAGGSALPVEFGRMPNKVHTSAFVRVYLGPILKHGYDFPRYVQLTVANAGWFKADGHQNWYIPQMRRGYTGTVEYYCWAADHQYDMTPEGDSWSLTPRATPAPTAPQ